MHLQSTDLQKLKHTQWEKPAFPHTSWDLQMHMQNRHWIPHLTRNVKNYTAKNLLDTHVGNGFLDIIPKTQAT